MSLQKDSTTGGFFDTLTAEERQLVRNRTAILVDCLGEWAQQYPKIHPVIPMIALTTATSLPRVSVSDALIWAQAVAWIFLVDYKADPQTFTPKDMRYKAEQWYSILSDWPVHDTDDSDELTRIVIDMTRNLAKSCVFEPLHKYWALRLHSHILGVAQEFQNAFEYRDHGPRALPPLDEYLRVGTQSVGFPFLGSMAAIIHEDLSVIEQINLISEVMEYAGAAARLYNDVATLEKEIQAGEVNSILIVYHAMIGENPHTDSGNALSEAKQCVLHLADSYARKCYDLIGRCETDSGQFEETVYRLVALHAHFYGYTEQDYHTTSLTKVHKMLTGSNGNLKLFNGGDK